MADKDEVTANQDLLDELDDMDFIPGQLDEDSDEDSTDEGTDDDDKDNTFEETETDQEDSDEEEAEDLDSEEDVLSDDEEDDSDDDSASAETSTKETSEQTDKEETSTTDEVSDIEALRNELVKANAMILELQANKPVVNTPVETSQVEKKETPVTPSAANAVVEFDKDYDFFQGENPEDVIEDKEKFNGLLFNFANQVSQKTVQQTMLAIPNIVQHHTNVQVEVQKTVDDFYKENSDLIPVKPVVGQFATQIASEHSDWDMKKVFNEAAKKSRDVLKMVKTKQKKKKNKKSPSDNLETDGSKTNIGNQKSRKSKMTKDKRTNLQRDLDEL